MLVRLVYIVTTASYFSCFFLDFPVKNLYRIEYVKSSKYCQDTEPHTAYTYSCTEHARFMLEFKNTIPMLIQYEKNGPLKDLLRLSCSTPRY